MNLTKKTESISLNLKAMNLKKFLNGTSCMVMSDTSPVQTKEGARIFFLMEALRKELKNNMTQF